MEAAKSQLATSGSRLRARKMLRACGSICASCTIGDVACQHFSPRHGHFEPRRTAAFAASGFFVLGPVSYTFLTTATSLFPGASTAAIARRIFAISCLEPIRLGVFLPATQLFQGHSYERALQKARDETLDATWRSWAVFTVPLFVGFRYLRPENRVPLLSAVGACWNTYLSWLAST